MPRHHKWLTNLEDTESNPLTRDRLLQWMVDTGYIEGFVRKRTSPLDYNHIDDYIQSVWEQICLIPEEKLLEIYRRGKGKFTSYIKALIGHQVYSSCSATYKENKAYYFKEIYLDGIEWNRLIEEGETNYLQQFPVKSDDKSKDKRIGWDYDYSGVVKLENNE